MELWVKFFGFCRYAFWNLKSTQAKKVKKLPRSIYLQLLFAFLKKNWNYPDKLSWNPPLLYYWIMQSQLCCYQIISTHLLVLTRLYDLIIKTSDCLYMGLLIMQVRCQRLVGSMVLESVLRKRPYMHKQNLPLYPFWWKVDQVCERRHMLKMPLTSREILLFPRYGLGGKYLVTNGVAWRPVSHTCAAQWEVGNHRCLNWLC